MFLSTYQEHSPWETNRLQKQQQVFINVLLWSIMVLFIHLLSLSLSVTDLCLPTHCMRRGSLLHLITLNDTHTHTRYVSSGRGIGPSHGYSPKNTQTFTRQTCVPGGIRTRNPGRPAALDRAVTGTGLYIYLLLILGLCQYLRTLTVRW